MLQIDKKIIKSISFSYRYANRKQPDLRTSETDTTFHYELKIPGYVKEDFVFYIAGSNLVITTDKSKINKENEVEERRHNYCYPSAYFKMKISLPKDIVRDRISVNYINEVLIFDLFKK
ncbi:Hsp20/alpha crystallin family protein [Seonamhaeicola sp. NFXS20]|uniref:Hsp20/alpha crystallin family protein n=1 Tax=Seonamhaeicola sp. NFXS20 TaxID=2816959 RepID=UPI003B8E9A71